MKKALTILAGALIVSLLSSQALAQDAAEAKSVNAVGVVKYTIPANGGLACISLPLNPMDTTSTNGYWVWGETSLAEQMDIGSYVYFWNGSGWAPYQKTKLRGWNNEAKTYEIAPGEAFFVQSAQGSSDASVVSLLGELPTEESMIYSVSGGNAVLETRGVTFYPVSGKFGDTALADALPKESYVYFWTGTQWAPYQKTKLRGWNNEALNMETTVGEGVFVQSVSDVEVTEERPFDWD